MCISLQHPQVTDCDGTCEPIECFKDCVILEGWRGMSRIRFTLNTMSVASMATNFILLLTSFIVATIQHPQKSTKCSKNHYFSFHYNTPPRKMFLCIEHASRTPSIKTLTLNADTFFRSSGRGLTRSAWFCSKVRVFSWCRNGVYLARDCGRA